MGRASRQILIALVLLSVFYMAGGIEAARSVRARWRAWQQPPTVEQVARAPVDTLVPLRATLPPVAGKMWLSEPPRPLTISIVLLTILLGAVIAMYVSGRQAGP
jgi:hypothetical protein